jgi:hypothetical protein
MSTLADIERLVKQVAHEAQQDGVPFTDRVDALKVLTPYFTAFRKDQGKDDPTEGTMLDFAKALQGEPDAGTEIRGDRRRQ